jgi:hypothetical protein
MNVCIEAKELVVTDFVVGGHNLLCFNNLINNPKS